MTQNASSPLTRRRLLGIAAGVGLPLAAGGIGTALAGGIRPAPAGAPWSAPGLGAAPAAATQASPVKLTFAWNTGAVCGAPIAAGQSEGIFAEQGLDVDFVNFAGSTEALLETLATGKADAAIGMALRWLKPLEQGFDVKIVAGVHAGCLRLLGAKDGKVASIADLKGKTVAISDLASPAKHFFAVQLKELGLDPESDVEWRVYPGDMLGAVVERGEAHAIAHWDPLTYGFLQSGKFTEIASNMDGEYANRACCVIGVRNTLLKEQPETVQALVRAVLSAQHFTHANPRAAAEAYQQFSPKTPIEDLEAQVRYHGHNHSPAGADLKRELAAYTEELKLIGVIRDRTDPAAFAERIYAHVPV
jgi:NitT/TauT family transport system substrate-binding protein